MSTIKTEEIEKSFTYGRAVVAENNIRGAIKVLTANAEVTRELVDQAVVYLREFFIPMQDVKTKLAQKISGTSQDKINELVALGITKDARLKAQKAKLEEYQQVIANQKKAVTRSNMDVNFMKIRIIKLYGHEGYVNIMAHVDCPGGFDILNYKKLNNLKL